MQDLRCTVSEHNKKKFISISLQDQIDKRLYCNQCQSDAQQGDLSKSQLIGKLKLCDLDEVMEGNQYNVYNWPSDDEGIKIRQYLLDYRSIDQQKKEIEDFFLLMKNKLIEQIENVKTFLIESLQGTQIIKDEKLKQQEDQKDVKKDDKKDTKKDDKKDTKKDTKKDDKKETKKETKKEETKVQIQPDEKLDQTPTIENLKKHYDVVYDLLKIKTIIKENAKSDPNLLSGKIHEYLNNPKRLEIQEQLRKLFINIQKEKNQSNSMNLNKYSYDSYFDQILKSVQQWTQKFGKVQWKFEIANVEQSNQIKKLQDGLEYAGAGLQSQIIYSNQSFNTGQHGCIILFKEFDLRRSAVNGNLFIGVVTEENKDKTPYGQGYRKDLFSANGEGLDIRIGNDFNNIFKNPPKLLTFKIDIDNNLLEICDGKRTVAYGLDKESKLKGNKWRIYIWWNLAADKVELIHSY